MGWNFPIQLIVAPAILAMTNEPSFVYPPLLSRISFSTPRLLLLPSSLPTIASRIRISALLTEDLTPRRCLDYHSWHPESKGPWFVQWVVS